MSSQRNESVSQTESPCWNHMGPDITPIPYNFAASEYSAPEAVLDHASAAPEVAPSLVAVTQQGPPLKEEKTSQQYFSDHDQVYVPYRSKSRKKWIISAAIGLVFLAVGLGVGLGIGLKTDGPEPLPGPIPDMSSKYCVSESNVLKSPRFENISDWTIANGILHFDQVLWNDSSPAGIFLPGFKFNYVYNNTPSGYQQISGLIPNKKYSLAFAITTVTVEAAPSQWAWDTFNFTVLASKNSQRSLSSTSIGLDIYTVGAFQTVVISSVDVYANNSGDIFVEFSGTCQGVDLYLYYISVFDPEHNTCDFMDKKPVFGEDLLTASQDSYHLQNTTIADSYCIPKSNLIGDPRFITVGTDNIWTLTDNLTYNFEQAEFTDRSPAGVFLPYVNDTELQPATDGNWASLEQRFTRPDPSVIYWMLFSYQYSLRNYSYSEDELAFIVRLRLSNSSTYESIWYEIYDTTAMRYRF
ncbi:hypothetical protein V1522DRAFT_394592 [Lipomyces starkeyi]